MKRMKALWHIFEAFLLAATFAASYNFYDPQVEPPLWFLYTLWFGIAGISIVWAMIHIVGGGIFGAAAGGIWDGIRMGAILGIGFAIGRLWSYVLAWAAGAFFVGPPLHFVFGVVIGVICLVIYTIIRYVWQKSGV